MSKFEVKVFTHRYDDTVGDCVEPVLTGGEITYVVEAPNRMEAKAKVQKILAADLLDIGRYRTSLGSVLQ